MRTLQQEDRDALASFVRDGQLQRRGAVMTDLDGTAVLEREGRIYLPPSVEHGLQQIRRHGVQVVANTLRFPRSVIDVFGAEWDRVAGVDLPLVSMKGSQIGRVARAGDGSFGFEEWEAQVLDGGEIDEILSGVEGMIAEGLDDLLVFHYPRDWRRGERIWTPRADHVDGVAAKYRSASDVWDGPCDALREALHAEPVCMVFLLIDAPDDRLMAYQHTQRTSFFTHGGTGKADGATAIARRLGIELEACIGAGDASTDDFLGKVGYAVIVGNADLEYRGTRHTARVADVAELGDLLAEVALELDR